jgi:aldehyde oxidoreductase
MADMHEPHVGMDTATLGEPSATTQVVQFYVNGHLRASNSDPITRLSDVLRDEFGLTGTKLGCSAGDCGLCTVALNEQQVCSCLVALGQVENQSVITVEGLGSDPLGKRLQQAFLSHGAAQCGICTPGMLMAAMDLLRGNANPTEAQVLDALAGVLCRCTGYRKIVEAVLSMSLHPAKAAQFSETMGHSGARLDKLDGLAKIQGQERFAADQVPKDCLAMRVVRSPHHHARFALNDFVNWANQQVGIKGVLIAKDIPFNRFAIFPEMRDQPALAETETRFMGEAVAVLVGDEVVLRSFRDEDFPISARRFRAGTGPRQRCRGGAKSLAG